MEDVNYSKYFPFREYYKKIVIPINSKRFKLDNNEDFMVCPLHNDHDPSLGTIKSKTKGEVYHCFGCNDWGNIVDFHIKISRIYLKKVLSYDESLSELCDIFGISKDEVAIAGGDYSSQDRYIRQQIAMNEALDKFDISDYKSMFIEGKMERKGINYFNSLLVRMIDYVKETDEEEEVVEE